MTEDEYARLNIRVKKPNKLFETGDGLNSLSF